MLTTNQIRKVRFETVHLYLFDYTGCQLFQYHWDTIIAFS